MKELYFGIIGCGSIAKKHVHCIEKLGHNIKGLCDKDLSKARDLNVLKKAENFRFRCSGCAHSQRSSL